jgi:hypothetical protein
MSLENKASATPVVISSDETKPAPAIAPAAPQANPAEQPKTAPGPDPSEKPRS